jgi:hypothetical protein
VIDPARGVNRTLALVAANGGAANHTDDVMRAGVAVATVAATVSTD